MLTLVARIFISFSAIAYEVIKIRFLSHSDHIQGLIKNSLGEKIKSFVLNFTVSRE